MAMAIFVDTGVFVAVRNKRDVNHGRGKELMRWALKGRYGRVYTSDHIIDEAITVALARTHNLDMARNTGRYIIDSPRIEKLRVGEQEFMMAWRRFLSLTKPMSFTDVTTLALMEVRGIERIMSFDADFDGLVERVA